MKHNKSSKIRQATAHLLGLEGQLNKQLLQLFVAIVDAKLLKAVGLEDLKAVNVEHADHGDVLAVFCLEEKKRGAMLWSENTPVCAFFRLLGL